MNAQARAILTLIAASDPETREQVADVLNESLAVTVEVPHDVALIRRAVEYCTRDLRNGMELSSGIAGH